MVCFLCFPVTFVRFLRLCAPGLCVLGFVCFVLCGLCVPGLCVYSFVLAVFVCV